MSCCGECKHYHDPKYCNLMDELVELCDCCGLCDTGE